MSWMRRLFETYEKCYGAAEFEKNPPNPVAHSSQNTQIQITLDANGELRRAELHELRDTTIPVTEESATRSGSDPRSNPLSDTLEFCGGDWKEFGGDDKRFRRYHLLLKEWCESRHAHPKACAVFAYINKRSLIRDLVTRNILVCHDGKINKVKLKEKQLIAAEKAWIRWRIECPGDMTPNSWEDTTLFQKWINFENSLKRPTGVCGVSGTVTRIARLHPRAIRSNSDRSKLVTSNDKNGFTFRGRFLTPDQAISVGFEVTQKAHNALRWLIKRQGHRLDSAVYVAWATSGTVIPDPFRDSTDLFGDGREVTQEPLQSFAGDVGQHFALRLNRAIAGYGSKLSGAENVVVLGLDSATDGRMAITFYREIAGSEFLSRISHWHERFSWPQQYSMEKQFVGAPSPYDIAIAAFGSRLDEKLRKATVERLLPCIVDGRPVPRDVIESVVQRAARRSGLKPSEWEMCLGIACGLFKGSEKEVHRMALEEERCTRDYLYGRLLAIAENIEASALSVAKEKRDTTAAKLMHRFAMHPFSTWHSIELALVPYRTRLRTNRPGLLIDRDRALDQVMCMFKTDAFQDDTKLSGEFLLGYHCQRASLWEKRESKNETGVQDESLSEGGTE